MKYFTDNSVLAKRGDNLGSVVGPQAEPVTVDELKTHLRIDHALDDGELAVFIETATDYVEGITGRVLITRTGVDYANAFPPGRHALHLRIAPIVTITSIQYLDSAETLQTLSSGIYTFDNNTPYHPVAYPQPGESWPVALDTRNAVRVNYTAGYQSITADPAGTVPNALKLAIKMLAGHLYENRESTAATPGGYSIDYVPMGFESLVSNYRLSRL